MGVLQEGSAAFGAPVADGTAKRKTKLKNAKLSESTAGAPEASLTAEERRAGSNREKQARNEAGRALFLFFFPLPCWFIDS